MSTAKMLLVLLLMLVSFAPAVESAETDKAQWNEKYSGDSYRFGKDPIPYLVDQLHRLPKGKALDLAMGEGRNGVFLATKGFQVTGLDISEKGLEKAQALAKSQGITIETKVADLDHAPLGTNEYDVVLCTYYVNRDLLPRMKQAVKPGGMVVVETYTMGHLKYRSQFRKEWLLEKNELLEWFKDFTILHYQVVDDGESAFAGIVAQKQ
jgi:2-polyprenyl-3-methyl-5-hydroxy-6-metoxy-1,4-benzoquinol methylase